MGLVYINPVNGDQDVRIHQARNRVDQNLLLKNSNTVKNRYKNIEKRYIGMLRKNIAASNDMSFKDLLKIEEEFKVLTGGNIYEEIQAAYVEQYNRAAAQINTQEILDLTTAMYNSRKGEKEEFLKYLNRLIEIIDGNSKGIAAWTKVAKNKNKVQFLSENNITLITRAKSLLSSYSGKGKKINIPEGTVRALATDISEYVTAAIGLAGASANYTIQDFLTNPAYFQKGAKTNIKFVGNKPTKGDIQKFQNKISKTADSVQNTHVSFSRVPQIKENGDSSLKTSLSFDAILNTKTYLTQDTKYLKLSSYGGENEILTQLLNQLYGSNWNQIGSKKAYMIYNALAFSYQKDRNDVVAENYRIIRNDVIAIAAEKYLAGLNSKEAPGFLVYNYTAYPILGIISQIIKEISEGNGRYGSTTGTTGKKDLFTVRLDVTSAYVNKWSNEPTKRASQISAINRVRKTKQAIHRLKTYGQINTDALKNIKNIQKVQGIQITT